MLISLIYVSTAAYLLSNEDLLDILHVSLRNNEVGPVTGLLLYKGGNFMQVLEGPREAVLDIYGKILKDTRHRDITMISDDPIIERQFNDWRMAFLNLDEETASHERGLSEFLQEDFRAEKFLETPSLAYLMLLSFKKNIR